MNIQTKASFKKELLSYFRTHRFLTIALVIIGLALLSPLLIAGMGALMDSMSELYAEMGTDVSEMTEILTESTSTGVESSIDSVNVVGLIVMILLLTRAAGGEQKKRSVIIPKSAGLRSFAYIFPKFIIYPLSAFVLAIVAAFISWAVSIPLFDVNDVGFNGVLLAGVLSGVHLMLYLCFHLTLGTATGKAGMSAAICIAVVMLVPNLLVVMGTDYMFNPFTINVLAYTSVHFGSLSGSELMDIAATVAFALGIMVVTYFIALFAQNARKIDNSGSEIDL